MRTFGVILPRIPPSIHPSSTKNSLWEDFFTYMWIKCSRHCSFIIVLINLHLGSYSSRTNTNTFLTNPMLLVSAGPLFFFHLPFPFLNVENIITRTPWMASISSLPSRPWQIFKTSYVSDSCTLQLLHPITTLTKINDIQLFFVTKKMQNTTVSWQDW